MIESNYKHKKSSWEDLYVSYDQLQDYLLAIDETNQIYTHSEIGKQAGFSDIPLPSTYPALFWQAFTLPWLTDQSSLILTAQKFEFDTPLTINQPYRGQITLKKLRNRQNKQWATHHLAIYLADQLVATVETTLVITGGKHE